MMLRHNRGIHNCLQHFHKHCSTIIKNKLTYTKKIFLSHFDRMYRFRVNRQNALPVQIKGAGLNQHIFFINLRTFYSNSMLEKLTVLEKFINNPSNTTRTYIVSHVCTYLSIKNWCDFLTNRLHS